MTSSRGQAGAQSEYAAEYERETGYPPDSRQAQLAAGQGRGAGAMVGSVIAGFLMSKTIAWRQEQRYEWRVNHIFRSKTHD